MLVCWLNIRGWVAANFDVLAQLHQTDLIEVSQEMEAKSLADASLDTPLFGSHTTGVDALWAGLPLITTPQVQPTEP